MTGIKLWQASLAAFIATLYWVMVIALPTTGDPWPVLLRWGVGILGGVLIVWGILGAARGLGLTGDDKAERFALCALIIIIGVVLIILAFITSHVLEVTPARRMAVGVGGAALAGFVFAVGRFDTLRAAASVPVVILLIGVVVWPEASDLIDDSIRQAVITWMGVILAANGAAEAAKQIGESNAKANAPAGVDVEAKGDVG
jgi:hypothetical protein